MQDARLVAASEQVIYPMIEKMIHDRLESACARFRAGEREFIADIAFITSLKNIYEDLTSLQKRGITAYEKLIKETEDATGLRE